MKTEQEFGTRILHCVDRGLQVIGQCPTQVIYSYLERAKNLKREEIPVDPAGFVLALEELFGRGARIIERAIVREIELAFGVQFHKDKLVEVIWETRIRLRRTASLVGASPVPSSKVHGPEVRKGAIARLVRPRPGPKVAPAYESQE